MASWILKRASGLVARERQKRKTAAVPESLVRVSSFAARRLSLARRRGAAPTAAAEWRRLDPAGAASSGTGQATKFRRIARAAFAGLLAAQATQACSIAAPARLVTLQYRLAGEVRTVSVRVECPRSRGARMGRFHFAAGRDKLIYVTLGPIVCFLQPASEFGNPSSLDLRVAAPLADGGYATVEPTPDVFGNAVTGVRVAEAGSRWGAGGELAGEPIPNIPVYYEPWQSVTYLSRPAPAFAGKFDRPVMLVNKQYSKCKGLPRTHEVENFGDLIAPRPEDQPLSMFIKDGMAYPPGRLAQSVSYKVERAQPYLGDTGPVNDPPNLGKFVGDLPIETLRCGVKAIGKVVVYHPQEGQVILIYVRMKV